MSFFNFFKKSKEVISEAPASNYRENQNAETVARVDAKLHEERELTNSVEEEKEKHSHEIPEHIFVEYQNPKTKKTMEPNVIQAEPIDLQSLYRYLEQNFESRGFEDALRNPDTSHMEEQVQYIHNDLNLLISKVKSYYNGHITKVDFHIATRQRSGMVETVDELVSHKKSMTEEMSIVASIEEDLRKGIGLSQNLFLSYKKGFKNGFAAITHNTIFNRR
jgi:hypothetical protein